jgi:hypothetical protein
MHRVRFGEEVARILGARRGFREPVSIEVLLADVRRRLTTLRIHATRASREP